MLDLHTMMATIGRAGMWLGPAAGVFFWWLGLEWELPVAGRVTWGLMGWMAVWWLTEAVPLAVTALLPLVVLPLGGAMTLSSAASPFASSIIFLFAGGFVLALAIQHVGLDTRLAMAVLSKAGRTGPGIVAAFMLATAALSAFISNTATAAMMLPLALSVLAVTDTHQPWPQAARKAFGRCLLLGIAYGATIGGVATIIGSPPNALAAEFMREELGIDVSFVGWMLLVAPLSVLLLPIGWFLLTRVLQPVNGLDLPVDFARSLAAGRDGGWTKAQRRVAAIFIVTAAAWLCRPFIQDAVPAAKALGDSGIAVCAAIACFIVPGGDGRGPILDIGSVRRLPWEILILFGGGLSLAAGVEQTGVADAIAGTLSGLPAMPAVVVIAIVAGAILLLTELTSNTATAATFIPVLAAGAAVLGVQPTDLVMAAAAAASCAFMLPVATPPNAIAFSAGRLEVADMARCGIWLNVVALLLIAALARWLWPWLLAT
ncbi:MAG: DASS family sodium-coupled anion symporter [Phycisphaerales bacterium]|jgi:sodium-dependent dicarboxylate transporter 2/3/5|nr:DASS family sodium-coupled anion symporter [Phycisphaerales bacterium]